MKLRNVLMGGTAALLLAAPAMAETAAMSTTDLNMRAGPGPGFAVVGVIPAEGAVTVMGCNDDRTWCQVDMDGTTGWAYGGYLKATEDEMMVMAEEGATEVTIETVTYEPDNSDSEAAMGLGATGAVAGALIAGPVGAAVGAAAGLIGGPITNPDGEVVTYVTENPVDPVYLSGEVVVGAQVPEEVVLYDTNVDEVRYANINGQLVLIEPTERSIVYIARPRTRHPCRFTS